MNGIITIVGSLNMDLLLQLNRWPERGETVLGRGYRALPGGKGANQAVAAARQGAQVRMVGCVGQDEFGHSLLASLRVADVDVQGVRTASSATGVAFVAVEPDGESRIVVVPGANRAVSIAHVEDERRALAEGAWLLLQNEIPMEATLAAAALADTLGVQVLLNPAPVPARGLPEELWPHVTLLVVNSLEARQLTGETEPERAAEALRARGPATVIVTQGAAGALLLDELGARSVPPFPVETVDSTAAGDAFVGALAAALARGLSVDEAARFGAAAGALAVTKLGAQPALPMLEATEALVAQAEGRSPSGYPEELAFLFESRDGAELLVRPILPADAPRLRALFDALSPESRYRRFFTHRQTLDRNEARALATVDYYHNFALVAALAEEPERLLAVARFARSEERAGAVEMAIVVADAFQHHGIGRRLFRALAEAAQQRGHRWMLVETQGDNQPMIELAEHAGFPYRSERDGTLLRLWLDLAHDEAP